MRRILAFALLAIGLSAQQNAGRILRIQIETISNEPIVGAKAVVAQTRQEGISQAGGFLELRLPATFGPGSDLTISVTYKDLVIHEPFNGDIAVPANPNTVRFVRMGPKGSTALLGNSGRQIVAASIRQQDAPSAGGKTPPEPKLTRYIREWASEYGFGVEEVQAEVRRWADDVEKKQAGTSVEDQALAAYAKGQFAEAAALFKDAAASALPRFEEARKRRTAAEDTERKELRAYLDGVVGEADSLKRTFRYREAREALDGAVAQVDKARYRSWWVEVVTRRADSLLEEGEFGAPAAALARLGAAIQDYRDLLRELAGAGDRQNWAATQNSLGIALESQGERSGGA